MTRALDYNTREARERFKEILDAADRGAPITITRSDRRVAAVDADRLVELLAAARPANATVVAEGGGWSVFIPGTPVSADGTTLDDALDEVVDALRAYAQAWTDRLRLAPNHAQHWPLVQLVALASDEQLRRWVHTA